MKVFVIGATGYIGGSVAKTLVDEGHEVFGLIRNSDKADALRNIGIKPVLGTLEDKVILAKYAQSCDAVINAANSDHKAGIETILESLSGTGKTFIHTSGSSIVGDDALGESSSDKIYSDDTPFTPINIRKERAIGHVLLLVPIAVFKRLTLENYLTGNPMQNPYWIGLKKMPREGNFCNRETEKILAPQLL